MPTPARSANADTASVTLTLNAEEANEPAELATVLQSLEQELDTPMVPGYSSEICLQLPAFVAGLANANQADRTQHPEMLRHARLSDS